MTLGAGAATDSSSHGVSNIDIYTERSTVLRLELKAWEKDFAAANGGRKAGRDDVKKNVDIAAKYKEYNKVRDILSGKISTEPPAVKEKQTPRKRKHEAELAQTSKRQIVDMMTPSKPFEPWVLDPYDSPSAIRKLFATPRKTAIGPTPQKDGQVLGLFDLLQEGPSPSKAGDSKAQKPQVMLQATPRKTRAADRPVSGTQKHSRTPASASKRYMLDMFATPLKNKNPNGQGEKTPSSVSRLSFATPTFLRRDSQRLPMPVVNDDEDGVLLSPEMARVPRKPIVRGLSSMLAGLREMQDEAADDDLEALREMEEEEAGGSKPAPKKPLADDSEAVKDAAILVEDSQPHILGGFDDEAMYDSAPEEPTLDRDGQPLKVYKKKGQKRTTRRVKMKPTRSKPQQTQPGPLAPDDSEDELQEPEEDPVPETQVDDGEGFTNARNFDSDSQSEYTASEGGTRYRRPDQSKKTKRITKDGKIKTVARKVGAMAHQNFKRLKLRNSGSKGGPAHNSRFRRTKK